jgi:ribonuclease HI
METDYLTKTLVIFFDGSITFNPGGDMSCGVVAYEVKDLVIVSDDGRNPKTEYLSSKRLLTKTYLYPAEEERVVTSNNMSEHLALSHAFLVAQKSDINDVVFFGDSEFVIKQMNEQYPIKDGSSYSQIAFENRDFKTLLSQSKKLSFYWIKRHFNIADKYSR